MSANVLSLVYVVRKLHGSSQPFLTMADDGRFYVVKMQSELLGPNVFFNEAAGTELYRALGLPVPAWRPAYVGKEFLQQNPICFHESPRGKMRIKPGLAFASNLICESGSCVTDMIPRSAFGQIRCQEQFWLAWLVDVCAMHSDNRQAVFARQRDGLIQPTFIDHGRMFGGAFGLDRPQGIASRYLDSRIYPALTPLVFDLIRLRLMRLQKNLSVELADRIPHPWVTASAAEALDKTLNRLLDPEIWHNILHSIASLPKEHESLYGRQSAQSAADGSMGILCA